MFERFTEGARQVVVLAEEEARALKHDYVGTEHLLLGLLREERDLAALALGNLDFTAEGVREQVVRIVGSGDAFTAGQIPFTPRTKTVLEIALREALACGHNYIGTEHILLGLVRENQGVASRVLLDLGADDETIRAEVLRLLGADLGADDETIRAQVLRPLGADRGPGRGRPGEGESALRVVSAMSSSMTQWRDEVSAALATITEALALMAVPGLIDRRRARRLVQDAITCHDPGALTALGPQAWEALVDQVLDANPDVERAQPDS